MTTTEQARDYDGRWQFFFDVRAVRGECWSSTSEGGGRGVRVARNGRGGGRCGLRMRRGRGVHGVRAGHACGRLGDGSDRRGPRASERGCANGRSVLMGGALCTERRWYAREGKRRQQGGPTGQRERERVGTRERGLAPTSGVHLSKGGCGRVHGLVRAGPNGLSWAEMGFPFFLLNFQFLFFLFSQLNSNQIKAQIYFKHVHQSKTKFELSMMKHSYLP
jgi:hypothetical protein